MLLAAKRLTAPFQCKPEATSSTYCFVAACKLLVGAPEVRELPDELLNLLQQREAARAAKDWALSDQLRATLESAGLEISDSATGQNWSWR